MSVTTSIKLIACLYRIKGRRMIELQVKEKFV